MSHTQIELNAELREKLGTRNSRRMRKEGHLPAVLYGHGEEVQSLTLPTKQTLEAFSKGGHVLDLKLEGKTQQVLVKDVQYDHLGIEILHVDLFRVDMNEEITSEVALKLIGEAKGAIEGGILTQMRDTLEIVCKVSALPDEITADISGLEIGDSLHIGDIKLPDGVRLPPMEGDFTVAMVAAPRPDKDEETPETGAPVLSGDEPEIIGDKASADAAGEGDTAQSPNA